MEKIIYIILLLILEKDFYTNIKTIKKVDLTTIVNKNNKLEKNYVPNNLEYINLKYSCKDKMLVSVARKQFEKLAKDASIEGYNIIAVSAYRSYDYQEKLYNNYVLLKGKYMADVASARSGHSEHQTGLAVDVSDITLDYDNFEKTKEFTWMKNNAYKYGFILRYPKAKFHITGFKYEPWHYRYVGNVVAQIIHSKNITLEEYEKELRNNS